MLMKVNTPIITDKQVTDTGMALTLLTLLLGFYMGRDFYFTIAVGVLLVNMLTPKVYYPITIVWLWLAEKLSFISSSIILTGIFILLVLPVGILRRMLGKDPLQLQQFKKGTQTVMKNRDHQFVAADIEKSF